MKPNLLVHLSNYNLQPGRNDKPYAQVSGVCYI